MCTPCISLSLYFSFPVIYCFCLYCVLFHSVFGLRIWDNRSFIWFMRIRWDPCLFCLRRSSKALVYCKAWIEHNGDFAIRSDYLSNSFRSEICSLIEFIPANISGSWALDLLFDHFVYLKWSYYHMPFFVLYEGVTSALLTDLNKLLIGQVTA